MPPSYSIASELMMAVCSPTVGMSADLIDSPSNLVMAVKTTVRAGMFRHMAKVSVAKRTCMAYRFHIEMLLEGI